MRYLDRKRRKRPSSGPHRRLDTATPGRQTVPVTSRDLKRLAAAVIALRTELGLSQEAFAERAGAGRDRMSVKTLQRVEAAAVDPRPKTLGAIDRAAGWPPGRSRALLDDEEMPVAPASRPEHVPKPMPADYPGELEYMEAVYWYLRRMGLGHEAVMRGFGMAAAIYARKVAERNGSDAPRDEVV
jgi:transcriptional regulator with XRE-family HTH domain